MTTKLEFPSSYWSVPFQELATGLGSGPNGITDGEAKRRLKVFGPNALIVSKRLSTLGLFLKQFASPLVLILIFAAVVSMFVSEWTDAAVILAIVVGSALVTFFQEYSASNAVAKLRSRLKHRVTVIREGKRRSIPSEELVPGDVVCLSAGSLIPADAVIFEATDFFVNQAVLTGETFPVEKKSDVCPANASLVQRSNCVYMGTSARSGTAEAIVVSTAKETAYGRIADKLNLSPPETEFQRGIRRFGIMLTRIMIGLVLAVFAINVFSLKPPIDSLLFAIALAVGISPELLPAIITINLSKGARVMARHGVIVRRLEAIENLGSMDILCADKTGTLTEGVIKLDAAVGPDFFPSPEVFRLAYINAHYQTGISNPLDDAITSQTAPDIPKIRKLGEIPYDFLRKRLSVFVEMEDKDRVIVSKGALDKILEVSTHVRTASSAVPLDESKLAAIDDQFREWSSQGFRVLGVASRGMPNAASVSRDDEIGMTFEGFLLFFDPPRADALETLESLNRLNVVLKIITGDNRYVASHVAASVGLEAPNFLTGAQIDGLSDEALRHASEKTTLFVEVDPNQKERIIRALRRLGHVVGYMGDGINDAPALHEADVGVSVEGAVDVAREAADFVLLRKNLDVLASGIEEGRITFANSLKYILTTESANFGNMFSMAAASAFLPFLPLLAKQVLLNNFLSDIPAIAIASDRVDREFITKPHRWDVHFIRNFMILFGFVSSIFDLLTFGLLFLVLGAAASEFQTGWFVESLLTELAVALVVRTRRPFYKSRPGKWLAITTALSIAVAIALPYIPGAGYFGFVPLPATWMLLLVGITTAYVLTTEAVKLSFYRRAGFV